MVLENLAVSGLCPATPALFRHYSEHVTAERAAALVWHACLLGGHVQGLLPGSPLPSPSCHVAAPAPAPPPACVPNLQGSTPPPAATAPPRPWGH